MKIPKINVKAFGSRLRELRVEKGWSMDKFCELFNNATGMNITKSTISRWEAGEREPMSSTLVMLADFYLVSPDYLIGITQNKLGYPDDTPKTKEEVINDWLDEQELEVIDLFGKLDVRGKTKVLTLLYQLTDGKL